MEGEEEEKKEGLMQWRSIVATFDSAVSHSAAMQPVVLLQDGNFCLVVKQCNCNLL